MTAGTAGSNVEPNGPPLAISADRLRLYGGILTCAVLLMPLWTLLFVKADLASRNWDNFRSAGATVGTADLLDPARHAAWQSAHHFIVQVFPYPPVFAWYYEAFCRLSPAMGITVNGALTILACAAAGLVAANIYRLNKWFALLAVFAWQPAVDSIQTAENGALFMLLAFLFVWAFVREKPVALGLAAGGMLLKPSLVPAFILFLAIRRQWAALAVFVITAVGLYLSSVGATGGDWDWPVHYVRMIGGYYQADLSSFAVAALTLPAMLIRAGLATIPAIFAGAALLLVSTPLLARCKATQAASFVCLVAVAAAPHAWGYDAALLLPTLLFAMRALPERMRTWSISAIYLVAATQSFMAIKMGFNPLSVIVILSWLVWICAAAIYAEPRGLRVNPLTSIDV